MTAWSDIPSLSALRAFEAAARTGSLSAAARELNVTHAAIAQHVRALEAQFGQTLLRRQGQGMAPTPEGAALAQELSDGFGRIAGGVRALRRHSEEGPLQITTTPNFAENWLMPRIGAFWKAHPEIPVTIQPDVTVTDMRRDGHHLAIRHGAGDWPGYSVERLTTGDTVVVGAPSLLQGRRLPAARIAELADLPWAIDAAYTEFLNWAVARGLDLDGTARLDFATNHLVLAASRNGHALCIQPRAVVERDLVHGHLQVAYHDRDDRMGYWMVTLPGHVSPRLDTLLRWLKRAV